MLLSSTHPYEGKHSICTILLSARATSVKIANTLGIREERTSPVNALHAAAPKLLTPTRGLDASGVAA